MVPQLGASSKVCLVCLRKGNLALISGHIIDHQDIEKNCYAYMWGGSCSAESMDNVIIQSAQYFKQNIMLANSFYGT